jgi:hypothetical protein
MTAPPPHDPHGTRPSRWVAAVALLLALSMLGVAVLQWRQYTLVSRAVADDGERLVLAALRAAEAHARLRATWSADPSVLDADGARAAHLETFVARVQALAQASSDAAARDGLQVEIEAAAEAVARSQRLIAQADAMRRGAGSSAFERVQLDAAMDPAGEALQALADASVKAAEIRADQRRALLREHHLTGLLLTAGLVALVIVFAAIARRQFLRLEQRRLRLEQLTDTLHDARREAEAASAAKSAFLANMSHELRTPFQGLLGMLSMLRETGLSPRQMDYLRTATESADHLLRILNDILDLSQLESGRLVLAPAAVDLRAMLRDVESLMRPQALRKHLALHLGVEPSVPERAMLDGTRVKQVLFNLLSNGLKFSERGAVVLDLRCIAAPRGRELVFVVTDTGIGMDEATLARLFRRFSQGDESRSRRYGGTGLGLQISRDLARRMGGDITVHSRPGEGSVFSFSVPLVEAPVEPAASLPAVGEAAGGARPLHVLVAEDHDVNRQVMDAVLESLGHRATFAANGQEAVEAVRRQAFDVVLMDLHMPVMDGFEATRRIRALPEPARAAVPIFALTADAFPETRDRCLVAGMNDFLTKPIVSQALATSLRRLFGRAVEVTGPAGAPVAVGPGVLEHEASAPLRLAPSRPPRGDGPSASLQAAVAPLDAATLNEALRSMPRERLVGLLRRFFDDAPATLDRLRGAVRDAQPLDLRVNAHAVRGAALNLGLSALAATAEALHEGASHLPAHEIALLVQRFEVQLQQARVALKGMGLWSEAAAPDVPPVTR